MNWWIVLINCMASFSAGYAANTLWRRYVRSRDHKRMMFFIKNQIEVINAHRRYQELLQDKEGHA